MELSDGEKLILMMLSEIHQKSRIENGVDSKLVQAAILSGNLWALKREFRGIFHGSEPRAEIVTEVLEILDKWRLIERSYGSLSHQDKAQLKTEAEPFGVEVTFSGFDGNYEAEHLGVAGFLVDDLGQFAVFKGRDLNSHVPCVDADRRMLAVFRALPPSASLTAADLAKLLKERIHPENRKAAAN
ncbi:MAG TPA: YfbU family protein [Candidatus Acidoferrum sp.]|nr:YfbU family protein [Candidatus Acidoferrum sp.]